MVGPLSQQSIAAAIVPVLMALQAVRQVQLLVLERTPVRQVLAAKQQEQGQMPAAQRQEPARRSVLLLEPLGQEQILVQRVLRAKPGQRLGHRRCSVPGRQEQEAKLVRHRRYCQLPVPVPVHHRKGSSDRRPAPPAASDPPSRSQMVRRLIWIPTIPVTWLARSVGSGPQLNQQLRARFAPAAPLAMPGTALALQCVSKARDWTGHVDR
jgi:hypothetical protein